MLCYFLITWIYNKKMEKTDFIPLAIAVVLIVLCNALLLTAFNRQNIFTKIFGAAINFNQIFGYSGLNEHNTYVKVLINTGYCGLVLFALLFFIAIKEINDTPDRKLSCYTLSVLMVFLIVGFSVPTILYTNCSWIPLFMIGGCISSAQENYNVEVVETLKAM